MRDRVRRNLEGVKDLKDEYHQKVQNLLNKQKLDSHISDLKLGTGDFSRDPLSDFIRVFVAALSNTFEHYLKIPNNKTYVILSGIMIDDSIFIKIVNYSPKEKTPKDDGSKAVIVNCLSRLGGELRQFEWVAEDGGKWITAFSFPTACQTAS